MPNLRDTSEGLCGTFSTSSRRELGREAMALVNTQRKGVNKGVNPTTGENGD